MEIVSELVASCRRRGTRVLLVYVPLDAEVQARSEERARHTSARVEALCRTLPGAACADVLTPLRLHRGQDVFFDDVHPTVAGHRIIGERLAEAILALARSSAERGAPAPRDQASP
jgi:lysophospholipase L1-like esterase